MIHHHADLFLTQVVERMSLRNNHSYEFMVTLAGTFLIGCCGITVEDAGSADTVGIIFDGFGIGKFTSVICSNDRDQSAKEIRSKKEI